MGLMNPDTMLYRENKEGELIPYSPDLTEMQKYLWEDCYAQDLNELKKLAGKDEIIVLHVGDLTQGYKHPALHVSTRQIDQYLIAASNLQPLLSMPNVKQCRLVAGTAAHCNIGAQSAVQVMQLLREAFSRVRIKVLYHGVLNPGIRIDYAHHGPGGGIRDWTHGNAAMWYLRSRISEEWKKYAPKLPPRAYVRGHAHVHVHVTLHEELGGQPCTFDLLVLPGYCGIGDFARQVTRSAWCTQHGMMALEVVGDELVQIHEFTHELDVRVEEKL